MQLTHPEIDLEIPTASKLSVADLECDSHLVVLVQRLVEAFTLVGLHLDVVCRYEGEEAARRSEDCERLEQHDSSVVCCSVKSKDDFWEP